MAEIKCPVCGKTGIPDYRVQDTVCQTCGADLSIYRLAHDIESVSDQSDGKKKGRLAWIIPAAIACLLAVALVFSLIAASTSRKALAAGESEASWSVSFTDFDLTPSAVQHLVQQFMTLLQF